jgi:hypothetical protein
VILLVVLLGSTAAAATQDELKDAAKKGQIVFVLVTQPGATGVDKAKKVIRDAMGHVENSVLIELNRADTGNAELVARYRVSGAPLPLILVVARNGALAGGGRAGKVTSEQLQKMVPTPKKAEILQALEEGKAVFAVFSRAEMGSSAKAVGACATACGQLKKGAVTIQIDMDDDKELPLLTQLKVDPASKEPVTLVFNKSGLLTGSYMGAVQVADLVQATTKKPSGCCPPGINSSKSCAPPKKKSGM